MTINNETSSVSALVLGSWLPTRTKETCGHVNKLLFEALGHRENHAHVALFSRHLTLIVQINTYGVFKLSENLR